MAREPLYKKKPPKSPKNFKGKVIKKAESYYMSNDQIMKVPFFIDMMKKLRQQGMSEAEAYSSAVSSPEWEQYSFLGDDG
tara:strand:+ start:796 stop:1035 length:240 start_codon:yes stop_codon:yes gene_type:complete